MSFSFKSSSLGLRLEKLQRLCPRQPKYVQHIQARKSLHLYEQRMEVFPVPLEIIQWGKRKRIEWWELSGGMEKTYENQKED